MFQMIANESLDPGTVVSQTVAREETSDVLAATKSFETFGVPVIAEF